MATRRTLLAAFALGTLAATGAAAAQTAFPSRPVTLIVPFPAGGSTDLVARAVATKIGDILGQPLVIVESRRLGRERRCRHGGQGGAGRLHAADGNGRDPRDQSRPLPLDAL